MNAETGRLSREQIDEVVASQADDLSKWESPVRANPRRATAIHLDPDTVAKAASIARRKGIASYRVWLKQIIRERIKKEQRTGAAA